MFTFFVDTPIDDRSTKFKSPMQNVKKPKYLTGKWHSYAFVIMAYGNSKSFFNQSCQDVD